MNTKNVQFSAHSSITAKQSNALFVLQMSNKVHGCLGHLGSPQPHVPSDLPARLCPGLCLLPFVLKN